MHCTIQPDSCMVKLYSGAERSTIRLRMHGYRCPTKSFDFSHKMTNDPIAASPARCLIRPSAQTGGAATRCTVYDSVGKYRTVKTSYVCYIRVGFLTKNERQNVRINKRIDIHVVIASHDTLSFKMGKRKVWVLRVYVQAPMHFGSFRSKFVLIRTVGPSPQI
jgi:hypothetical protein